MVKFWQIGLTAALFCNINTAQSRSDIYIIPEEAKCTLRKADKLTYCTDLDGKPITGELHRYQNNNLIRMYPLQDGLLNGAAITYYANGRPKSEKTYTKGILNGPVREYYYNGSLQSEIPYVNGKKEGIAKSYQEDGKMFSQMIYSEDALNGEMRLYTPEGKTLYSFENEENKLVSGTYFFRRPNGIDDLDIPEVIIEALNHACVELQEKMTDSACAVVYKGPLDTCDEAWRKANRKAVRKYLAECAKGVKDEQY